ncbi:hypothetical protein D046_5169B, partial [Vibrio parahaemolyticus V-223/04]
PGPALRSKRSKSDKYDVKVSLSVLPT